MRFFLGLIVLLVSIGGCSAVFGQRDNLEDVTGTVFITVLLFIVAITLLSGKNEKTI